MVLKTLTLNLLCFVFSITAFANIDSLIQIAKTHQDTNAVMAGYQVGMALTTSNLDSSYLFLVNAAKLADKLDFVRGKLATYKSVGNVASRIGKYEEGLIWLEKGVRLVDSLHLPIREKVILLNNIGIVRYTVGFLGKAIEPYIEAIQLCRDHGLDEQRSMLLNNLGIFYRALGRYEEAIGIYEQSYSLRKENKDSVGLANILFNMGAAYSKMEDHENSIKKLEEAELIYIALGNELDVAHCAIAKGMSYFELNDVENAIKQYEIARKTPYDALQAPFNHNLYLGLAMASSS